MPLPLTVDREMPSTHDNDGASATGGGITTGGSGVGATGVLVHDATDMATATHAANADRVAQCFAVLIYVN